MAKQIKKRSINLLPNKEDSFLNQFLLWALSIGRLLVILVETLALSVFIYRFSLDVKIIDLHDKIKSESLIVKNFKEGEATFRNLHSRLAFAKEYDSTSKDTVTILNDVIAFGRNRLTFRSITVGTEDVTIEAEASNAKVFSVFTQSLKNHPKIQSVSINRVDNKTSNGVITVNITAQLKTSKLSTSQSLSEDQVKVGQ